MTPLSVAIIARDEADRIADAIRSVAFADEVVVVDSGSTDGTPAICRALGARVIEAGWPGHVAQKNRALGEVSHDHVLSIDADERVPAALAARITALQRTGWGERTGWSMPRLGWWLGQPLRHGTWYPDRRVRLVDRRVARWTGLDPHDHLQVDGPVGPLAEPLHHHPYRSLAEHLATIDRYTARHAETAVAAGVRARPWDLALRPPAHLLKALVLKGGVLDGPRGLAVAWLGAAHVQLKWLRIYLRSRETP